MSQNINLVEITSEVTDDTYALMSVNGELRRVNPKDTVKPFVKTKDIVDNLESDSSDAPLSARMGKELKKQVDESNMRANNINPSANTLQSTESGKGRVLLSTGMGLGVIDFEIEESMILRLEFTDMELVMQIIDYNTGTYKTKTIAQFD